jgi:acyl-homoserine-lactone acylase
MLRRIVLGLVVLVAMLGIAGLVWEPLAATSVAGPPPHRYDGRIVRDEWGVPHLFGRTDADAVYALAYAHAEDDFSTLQEVVAMTRGRSGALIGQDGAKIDYVLALLGVRATVDAKYDQVPADVRTLLDAYASGLNLYAARHPEEVKLAKLFPVEGKDVAAGFVLRSPFFFGLDETLGALTEGKALPPESAAPMIGSTMDGSNAFAVAPKRSGDGHTRLISNSHQPWTGGVAWYELSIHSGQGWDFAGATFPGGFVPFLGHNKNLGWTNTVNRPDLVDVYKLVTDADRTHYRFDGKWLPLESARVWLPVKIGPFVLPVPKTTYRSVHGPVILNKDGAYAIHYAGMGTMGMLEQYYRITKAQNWDQWSKAMALHAIPATNFIYADRTGRIAHVYNAQFPLRKPGYDYRTLLPGDTSRDLASGQVPWSMVPQHVDPASGFLENSNNSPFQAAGPGSELDPKSFSPLLGIERDVTNRSLRGVGLMAATPRIDEAELLRIKFDTGYDRAGYAGKWMAAMAALDVHDDPRLQAAQRLLGTWDWSADGKGTGDALAALVLRPAMKWSYKRAPVMPDLRNELKIAADHLMTHFGTLDPPLGALMRVRRGKVDLPMDGASDTLRAATLWDLDPDGRARVKHGDSFVMLIDWDATGRVASRSIQPFGAATTRPQSPHYADQAALFVKHQFKPVHFDRADITAHAARIYRP